MKFSSLVIPVLVLAAVIAVAVPLVTAEQIRASATGEAMMLTLREDGVTITDTLGNPVKIVSEEKDAGQVTAELVAENGAKGTLVQLNWLTAPETDTVQQIPVEESEYLDEEGNLVSSGWVTPEQTKIPENVIVKPLLGVLSEVNTIQLGWYFTTGKAVNIYRDEKLIATTEESIFVDRNLKPATSYKYQIVAVTEKADTSESGKDEFEETTFVDNPNNFSLSVTAQTVEGTISEVNSSIGKTVNYSQSDYYLNSWMHVTKYSNNYDTVKLWNFTEPDFSCLVNFFFWCDNSYMASESA